MERRRFWLESPCSREVFGNLFAIQHRKKAGWGGWGGVSFYAVLGGGVFYFLLFGRERGLRLTFLLKIRLWRRPFSQF